MSLIHVKIEHIGHPTSSLDLDTSSSFGAFTETLSSRTKVPVNQMKVMTKGRLLKDDNWAAVGFEEDMKFWVLGSSQALPKSPKEAHVFSEDMLDILDIDKEPKPTGLMLWRWGACYVNATLQMLRAIPELQRSLDSASASGIPADLGRLYADMFKPNKASSLTDFIGREVLEGWTGKEMVPFVDERSNNNDFGYNEVIHNAPVLVQKDVGVFYSQMLNEVLGEVVDTSGKKLVESYMMSRVCDVFTCDEGKEMITKRTEALKVRHDIKQALTEKVTRHSPTLGQDVEYSQYSRLERLPTYLTFDMHRFDGTFKSHRQIQFEMEYDALDIVTADLNAKIKPAHDKLRDFERERRRRNRDNEGESALREKESKELEELIPSEVKEDVGANPTGFYDLVAIIAHEGRNVLCSARNDPGHYTCYIKKSALYRGASETGDSNQGTIYDEEKGWYKFDDDEDVCTVGEEYVKTLDGGGVAPAACLLLYKSKPLA